MVGKQLTNLIFIFGCPFLYNFSFKYQFSQFQAFSNIESLRKPLSVQSQQ